MYSKYELLYLIKILDYYEQGLVRIIEYYINTYTFICNLKDNNIKFVNTVVLWCRNSTNKKCLNKYGHISNWNVSNITSMKNEFNGKSNFNDDISRWNTSNVTNMNAMFQNAKEFNQPIGNWEVSNVIEMQFMFLNAVSFNQPLNNWDVSNVSNMNYMFYGAKFFNQSLCSWNVSNVTNMNEMFYDTYNFNQSLCSWDFSNISKINGMCIYIKKINGKLNRSKWGQYLIDCPNMYKLFESIYNYHIKNNIIINY